MVQEESPLQTLKDIRSIMERSSRFLSLSGWSGIWAGSVALAGSYVAYTWLNPMPVEDHHVLIMNFIWLAVIVFLVALAGGFYFTWRKANTQGGTLWNNASRRMMAQMAMPLLVGGTFALHLLYNGHESYIMPVCLAFYGMALINGSKYTLTDIQYLGMLELVLACLCLFMPAYALVFWVIGFGLLHILYGIMMWNKYDKHLNK